MRSQATTLIDQFELGFRPPEYSSEIPIELPAPAIERYRVPMRSLDLEVEFEDESQTEWFLPRTKSEPEPEKYLRARCWVSEE
jgi:hypothetical protein